MEGAVPMPERKKRNKMLRILSEKKQNAFYWMNEGRTVSVLWEHENINGLMEGYSENYIRAKAGYNPDLANSICEVRLENCMDGIYSVSIFQEIQQD